jgi:hypothetical protein
MRLVSHEAVSYAGKGRSRRRPHYKHRSIQRVVRKLECRSRNILLGQPVRKRTGTCVPDACQGRFRTGSNRNPSFLPRFFWLPPACLDAWNHLGCCINRYVRCLTDARRSCYDLFRGHHFPSGGCAVTEEEQKQFNRLVERVVTEKDDSIPRIGSPTKLPSRGKTKVPSLSAQPTMISIAFDVNSRLKSLASNAFL